MRPLSTLLVAGVLAVPVQDHRVALSAMAEAERDFARAAAERGIRTAFIEFLDDEAIAFQPTLANAKEGYRASPESPNPRATTLQWEPRTGAVAGSGELGWLTGPYTLIPGGDATRTRTGCYFSVWRRVANGPWRVMIDVGITTPEPCAFGADGFVPMPDEAARFSGPAASGRQSLRTTDAEVARATEHDGAATSVGKVASAHIRLHRNGQQPIVGRAAAVEWLRSNAGGLTFTPVDGAAAASADLGYTYGRYRRATGAGYYLRVWHRAAGGTWTLVADVESPTP